jgi:excisionase family DNA binding protein
MSTSTPIRPSRPLSVRQLADRLGCSADKVYELLDEARFPGAYRLDPRRPKSPWRVPQAALEAFLAAPALPAPEDGGRS